MTIKYKDKNWLLGNKDKNPKEITNKSKSTSVIIQLSQVLFD